MSRLSVWRCLCCRAECCSSGSAGSCLRILAHRFSVEERSRFCSSAWCPHRTQRHTLTTPSTLTSDRQLQEETSRNEVEIAFTSDIICVKCQTLKGDNRTPGHARGKQARLSNWAPPQAPPGRASLKMSLCRNREPRPQDTLHALHVVHGDMMQSTREERKKDLKISLFGCLFITTFEMDIYILPQSFSSDPSTQSFCRSQRRSRWTHSPLSQENCLGEQGLGTSGVTTGLAVVPGNWRTETVCNKNCSFRLSLVGGVLMLTTAFLIRPVHTVPFAVTHLRRVYASESAACKLTFHTKNSR